MTSSSKNLHGRWKRSQNKALAVEHKGGKCSHCSGVFHPAAFDFHHTDPTKKDFDPGALMKCSLERLFAEIDKCILLCANCHRIHHYEEANKDLQEYSKPQKVALTYNNQTKTLDEWAESTGLKYETIRARVREYGWDVERALTTPARGSDK